MKNYWLLPLCGLIFIFALSCTNNDDSSFELPTVVFDSLYYANNTTALCEAEVTYDGNSPVFQRGFCWSLSSSPKLSDDTLQCNAGLGHYTGLIARLLPDRIYYIRPFAINKIGVAYGEVRIFTSGSNPLFDGYLITLSGWPKMQKHWVLDKDALYFHKPLDFYGDTIIDPITNENWGPFGGTNFYDWDNQGAESGSIHFEYMGGNIKSAKQSSFYGNVTLTLNGIEKKGSFDINKYKRDPNFLTLANGELLWSNMLNGHYKYLGTLSETMADVSFSKDIRFPIDSTRYYDKNILPNDLQNITIMHLSDSALIIRILQSYQNGIYSPRWCLYNYIVQEYKYSKP